MTKYTLRNPEGYGNADPTPVTRDEAEELLRGWYNTDDMPAFDDVWEEVEEQSTITVLIVEPDALPRVAEISADLDTYQTIVDGYIEATYPYADTVALVCNEEGKLDGSAPNRPLLDYDVIYGTFFVCGLGEEDFTSLNQAQIERYSRIFAVPGMYFGEPDTVLA